ncbi:MAG: hypothetical protein HY423_06455 [Candidatus Lambdaproteobacteria bacterium]|nr:hypothetical protein [Candidatus Lambdaproteobacteria bacterium]
MTTDWIAQRTPGARLLAGAIGGALGGLAFLPVMLLLQPTLWAQLVRAIAPALAGTPAEFGGWLLHMTVLTAWGALFAALLSRRDAASVLIGALGWAFILAWFSAVAITLVQGMAIPPIGWVLETLAHAAYGIVLAGVLLFLARQDSSGRTGSSGETAP